MTGFVMNTRRDQFADWRVRDAMMHVFNFEFINEAMTGSAQPRITSYWSNSPLGMSNGPAEGRVLEFLEPYATNLTPGTIEGYALPVSDGTERNRAGTATALAQMEAAGWTVKDGAMKNAAGEDFMFEILLQTSPDLCRSNFHLPAGVTANFAMLVPPLGAPCVRTELRCTFPPGFVAGNDAYFAIPVVIRQR